MDANLPPESPQPQEPLVTPHVVAEPPRGAAPWPPSATASPPPRPRRRTWAMLLLLLLLLGLAGSVMLNVLLAAMVGLTAMETDKKVREKFHSHQQTATDKVAIIGVEGVISDGEGFMKNQIDRAAEDENVKAIVLRVVSPGGSVSASDYIYHRLSRVAEKKPLVVSMGGIAASGGYYVSMAVGSRPDTIFAEPTTWTGSIGVIIPHYNLVNLLEKVGVTDDSIVSAPLKGIGSMTKPMTKQEQAILQGLVNDSFGRFKKIIQSGRPKFQKDPAALEKVATGQVFTADQAQRDGLVDKIGFLDDAIDQAIKLAKLDKDDVKVVEYKREASLANLLGASDRSPPLDLNAMLEMTAPRAYYLCTWLPSLQAKRD